MTDEEIMKKMVGRRVLMVGDHPWKGQAGTIVRFEKTPFGTCPVVDLDNGQSCFAMKPNHIKALPKDGHDSQIR